MNILKELPLLESTVVYLYSDCFWQWTVQVMLRNYERPVHVVPVVETELVQPQTAVIHDGDVPMAHATPLNSSYSQNQQSATVVTTYVQPVTWERLPQHRLDYLLEQQSSRAMRYQNRATADFTSLTRWRDNLCNCWSQIYPSCVCSFMLPCVIVGDVTAKISYMPFFFSFSAFVVLYFVSLFLFATKNGLGGALITWGFLALFVCSIRKRIRIQNNFPLGNDMEDCSNSCCCMYCVISQMARHVFAYKSRVECDRYRLPSYSTLTNSNQGGNQQSSRGSTTRSNRIPGRSPNSRGQGSTTIMSRHPVDSRLPSATVTAVPPPTIAHISHVENTDASID